MDLLTAGKFSREILAKYSSFISPDINLDKATIEVIS